MICSFTCLCNIGYIDNGLAYKGTLFKCGLIAVVTSDFELGRFVNKAIMFFIMAEIMKLYSSMYIWQNLRKSILSQRKKDRKTKVGIYQNTIK